MAGKLQLHWSPRSPYVRKVMVCVHELDMLPRIELVRSVTAMLVPHPALMVDNPLSKIPTLVLEDRTVLFDSIVICEYLNDLAGGPLFPREGRARWQALRWHALADGVIDALILWRNERERAVPLQQLIDAFEIKVAASLVRLQEEVADLRAAPFAIGHVTVACALGYLDYRFDAWNWRARVPELAAWEAQVRQRPSVQKTIAVDG